MSFSICIVLHNSAAELERLLDSIDTRLAERPQIICVDSGSNDDGAELAKRRGCEVIVMEGNPGFGAANNAALALAREPVTVLLNPDCLLLDDQLERLVALAAGQRALLAPRLLNDDGSLQRSAHPLPAGRGGYFAALGLQRLLPGRLRCRIEPYRSTGPVVVGWAIGACLAAQTSLLTLLGPFNDRDFLFSEDLDLCLRARALAVPTVFDPSVTLVHSGAHTSADLPDQQRAELQARRRREVIEAQLGEDALRRDDRTQALTFRLRALLGRQRRQNLLMLRSLRSAQNRSS